VILAWIVTGSVFGGSDPWPLAIHTGPPEP
jgi:low affinity Fe/Cu permease